MSGIISGISDAISNISLRDTGSSLFTMLFQNNQTQLGYLFLDVLLQENLSLPSEVTKYPVEDGTEDISDHITRNNEELTINGAIAAGSTFGIEFGTLCYSKLIDAVDVLRGMHKERKPVTVITGLGRYEDMGFSSLTIQRSAQAPGGQWLTINATLRKIKKVALKEANLPPDNTSGDANGKTGDTERRGSKSGESNEAPKTPATGERLPTMAGKLTDILKDPKAAIQRVPGIGGLFK